MDMVVVFRSNNLLLDGGMVTKSVKSRRREEEQEVTCWRINQLAEYLRCDLSNASLVD